MSKTPYIKAPLWIYVNKIEKIVGGESWRFECKFCSNTYVGSYTRVVTHLLQEVVKGIKGCLKVTPQQKVNMKKLVNDCKERIKRSASTPVPLPSSSRKASASSLDYDMSYKFPDTSETVSKKRKAREQCDGEIFRMFCTSGLSFNVARNPHYRNSYVRASQIPGYVPPGYNALRTTLLQKERKNIEVHLQPLKDSWKQKGVSDAERYLDIFQISLLSIFILISGNYRKVINSSKNIGVLNEFKKTLILGILRLNKIFVLF
ncbi:unnamed protein product [Brassica oleracea var. botrytis]